jgi:hypothetical protein
LSLLLAVGISRQDVDAQLDALVADIHAGSGDHLLDVEPRLATETAPFGRWRATDVLGILALTIENRHRRESTSSCIRE